MKKKFYQKTLKMNDGAKIAVWDTQGKGTPIVFVHGFPETHLSWTNLLNYLPKTSQYRYIMYDLRGHGESSKIGEASLDRFFQDHLSVLQKLKIKKYHLVGHDWGGTLAMHAVRFTPDTLYSLSVLNTNYGKVDFLGMWHILFLNLPWIPELAFYLIPERLYEFSMQKAYVNIRKIPSEADQAYRKLFRNRQTTKYWLRLYRNLLRTLLLRKVPLIGKKLQRKKSLLKQHIHAWKVPTALIWGKNDTFNPLWVGKELEKFLKGRTKVQLYEISHAGHFVHVEKAKEVASILERHWRV